MLTAPGAAATLRAMSELRSWAALLGLLLALPACGDDDGPTGEVDAGADLGSGDPPDLGPPPAPIPKRPWVLGVTTTSAVVRWETPEAPETVELVVTPEDGGDARTVEGTTQADEITLEHGMGLVAVELPDLPGTYHLQEVTIDGLEPATCYAYEVPDLEEDGRFCTTHLPTDHATPIELLVVGDTSPLLGDTGPLIEAIVEPEVEMTLHAGDLQYYDAVFETWAGWFPAHAPILSQGAFWPTIGNHEEEKDGAEFDQSYARYFANPSADGDTSAYHFESGGIHFFSVNSEDDIGEYDADFSWLDEQLTAAEAADGFRGAIVFYHRPIYSLARHAPPDDLRAALEPVLTAHDVKLVLQGHNHVYERFEVDGLTYLVTGGGGAGLYDIDAQVETRPDEVPLRVAKGRWQHGVRIRIEETEMQLRVIDREGTLQDEFTIAL
jgi:hypothetical protein